MKRQFHFLFGLMLFATFGTFKASAQEIDTVPYKQLIISEINHYIGGNWTHWGYIELTNIGDKEIDLSRFVLMGRWGNGNLDVNILSATNQSRVYHMTGMLKPGEQRIIVSQSENKSKYPDGKWVYPNQRYSNPEALKMAGDTLLNVWNSVPGGQVLLSYRVGLYCQIGATSYVMIDSFGEDKTNENPTPDSTPSPVAGINLTPAGHVFIRKTNVTKGNEGDWSSSRGTDAIDSEWMVVPKAPLLDITKKLYTTLGSYKKSEYSLTANFSGVSINEANKEITVPNGARRDSFEYYFNMGPDLAYEYKWGQDSTNFFTHSDDTFKVYHCTDAMVTHVYKIKVQDNPNYIAVSSLIYKDEEGEKTSRYAISFSNSALDTISDIPFATRTDTLLKYLSIPEGAIASFEYASGVVAPDITKGDKLVITKGEVTKKYYLNVDRYWDSYNPYLKYIIVPGYEIFTNPQTYLPTDTLQNFSATSTYYGITLPRGTKTAPAIVAVPVDPRCKVVVKKAKNIFGSGADKETIITVTTEGDSVMVYKVAVTVDKEQPDRNGEPFFTDFGEGGWGSHLNVQLFNPRNTVLDLTQYIMFCDQGRMSLQEVIDACHRTDADSGVDWRLKNQLLLRFGYMFEKDPSIDKANSVTDLVQPTTALDPFGTYWSSGMAAYPIKNSSNAALKDQIDMWTHWAKLNDSNADQHYVNKWGRNWTLLSSFFNWSWSSKNSTWGIAKIINDSVMDNTKKIVDEKDFEIVDIFKGFGYSNYQLVSNSGKDTVTLSGSFKVSRKPWVYTGNPIPKGSFGSLTTEPEWEVTNDATVIRSRFHNHTMLSFAHVPTITSTKYLISEGLTETESVVGVTSGTTIGQFLGNISKADEKQMLKFMDSNSNVLSDEITELKNNYKLEVTSADGFNKVVYILTVGAGLDNNTKVTSTAYQVTHPSTTKYGKISGVALGTSLEDFISKVTVPSLAKSSVQNNLGEVLAMEVYNNDTNLIKEMKKVKALVDNSVEIEVVAQNGTDTAIYKVELNAAASDAYLLSTVYQVNEEQKYLAYVYPISVPYFLNNLIDPVGAKVHVENKMGQMRDKGYVSYDDKVVVVSADGNKTVKYNINFIEEVLLYVKDNKIGTASIYPNPAIDVLNISYTETAAKIKVVDLSGKDVISKVATGVSSTLNIADLARGIYIIVIEHKNGSFETAKFIKQ